MYEEMSAAQFFPVSWDIYQTLPGSDRWITDQTWGGISKATVIAFYRLKQKEHVIIKSHEWG